MAQFSTLLEATIGFAVSQISNQGVFPLSFAGILSSIGILGIIFLTVRFSFLTNVRQNRYFLSYWVGSILLIISGIGGKFRNFVTLSPWHGLWISTAQIDHSKRKIFGIFLACVIVGNLVGVFNVLTHRNTTKNSWNLPTAEILDYVEKERLSCEEDLIILTHDPTLTYILERRGFRVLSRYSPRIVNTNDLQKSYRCVLILSTYAGSISDQLYESMYHELDLLTYDQRSNLTFGFDKYHKIKNIIDKRYPEFQVKVLKYSEVRNIDKLNYWYRKNRIIQM